jgi:hypothetical protein
VPSAAAPAALADIPRNRRREMLRIEFHQRQKSGGTLGARRESAMASR